MSEEVQLAAGGRQVVPTSLLIDPHSPISDIGEWLEVQLVAGRRQVAPAFLSIHRCPIADMRYRQMPEVRLGAGDRQVAATFPRIKVQ